MTPKRREAINLSWFFSMPLLQQIPANQYSLFVTDIFVLNFYSYYLQPWHGAMFNVAKHAVGFFFLIRIKVGI